MAKPKALDPTLNLLFYGDNLDIMREHLDTESVDLVYLDPPFNSNRSYNILFKNKAGVDAQAQLEAFDDTWHWSQQSDATYKALINGGAPIAVADAIEAMRKLLGTNDVLAYLVMMTPRLVELHRVLKDTGSLYLHCDPTASHYLKIMLDAVFGPTQFRNEIIWRRTGSHGHMKRFGPVHDVILFYTKSDDFVWNRITKRYMKGHVQDYFEEQPDGRWRTAYYGNVLTGSGTRKGLSGKPWQGIDPTAKGRHWAIPGKLLDEVEEDLSDLNQHEKLDRLLELGLITIEPGAAWPMYEHYIEPDSGTPAPDIWSFQPYTEGTVFGTGEGIDADVRWLSPKDSERLGYPTQKPVGLLERIIRASTDEGDVVLDPFCGCGTTVDAAQKLHRRWIGIDVTTLSIDLIRKRLRHMYTDSIEDEYEVYGIPKDAQGAQALFETNAFDFERWAVGQVNGQPNQKQVGDRGVDGRIRFPLDNKGNMGTVIVSVKGGKTVTPAMVRELEGTVKSENAEMGLLITIADPKKGMRDAADSSGEFIHPASHQRYPVIQMLSMAEFFNGKRPNMPTPVNPYVQAKARGGQQLSLI